MVSVFKGFAAYKEAERKVFIITKINAFILFWRDIEEVRLRDYREGKLIPAVGKLGKNTEIGLK